MGLPIFARAWAWISKARLHCQPAIDELAKANHQFLMSVIDQELTKRLAISTIQLSICLMQNGHFPELKSRRLQSRSTYLTEYTPQLLWRLVLQIQWLTYSLLCWGDADSSGTKSLVFISRQSPTRKHHVQTSAGHCMPVWVLHWHKLQTTPQQMYPLCGIHPMMP